MSYPSTICTNFLRFGMVAKWFLSKVEHVKKFTGGQMNTYTWSEKLICAFSSGELKCFKNLYICRTKQDWLHLTYLYWASKEWEHFDCYICSILNTWTCNALHFHIPQRVFQFPPPSRSKRRLQISYLSSINSISQVSLNVYTRSIVIEWISFY